MKKYTIGICFNHELTCVLLIQKSKPDWQKGYWNFPGGKVEFANPIVNGDTEQAFETPIECIAREFTEETNLRIPTSEWKLIGQILNPNNYEVSILTTILPKGQMRKAYKTGDEAVKWCALYELPYKILPNIKFLMEYTLCVIKDELKHARPVFTTFLYNSKS